MRLFKRRQPAERAKLGLTQLEPVSRTFEVETHGKRPRHRPRHRLRPLRHRGGGAEPAHRDPDFDFLMTIRAVKATS